MKSAFVEGCRGQCDQIGWFIGLWTTVQSLWQQLTCPNLPHSCAIFVKVSKSLNFQVKSFLGNFYRHLATFYWSHWYGPTKGFLFHRWVHCSVKFEIANHRLPTTIENWISRPLSVFLCLSLSVWLDLVKFRHFGMFEDFSVFDNFGKCFMQFGNIYLFQMAK